MNEFDLIARYFSFAPRDPAVVLGSGDDAAIIELAPDDLLVVASDMLVAGRHFPEPCNPAHLAARALRVNLSDLAAMAATPRWFTLAISLPEADPEWLEGFSQGLLRECAYWQLDLIGGDTTRGSLTISIQMMGTVNRDCPAIRRSGAQPGDHVMVTGSLGDAAGWIGQGQFEPSTEQDYLYRRFWFPEPRLNFARAAQPWISAACDISDGLLADLQHICKASGIGARVQADRVPLSPALCEAAGTDARALALGGGDDYELCLAVPAQHLDEIQALAQQLEIPLTSIGQFEAGDQVLCLDERGQQLKVSRGYQHFP